MSVDNQNISSSQGEMIECPACGKEIHSSASICPHCGAQRRSSRYKSKTVAALFAFLLGGFGGHRFYLGQWWGIFYLLFFWLWIPGLIALIEFIYFLMCNEKKWDEKYNEGIPAGPNDNSSGVLIAILIVFGGFFFIAIIGILAAIALPAYQDYTIRAKLYESHTLAKGVMQEVEDYVADNQQWPANVDNLGKNKLDAAFVESVVIDQGVIYVTPNQVAGVEGNIIYIPSKSEAGITWSCTESTITSRYLPQECRQ